MLSLYVLLYKLLEKFLNASIGLWKKVTRTLFLNV